LVDRVVGDAGDEVVEVFPGVQAGAFGGVDQGQEHGSCVGSAGASGKEPVLAAQSRRTDRAFHGVVVDR